MALFFIEAAKRRSKGVTIFAWIYALISLDQLLRFNNYAFYQFEFQQWLPGMILLRYGGSLLIRGLGLFIGVELLLLREYVRRMVIGLSIYHLLTVYWRHPYATFHNIAIWREYVMHQTPLPAGTQWIAGYPHFAQGWAGHQLMFPSFPIFAMFFFISIDVIFHAAVLYFFTRPAVRAQFR